MREDSLMNRNKPIAHIDEDERYHFLCDHLRDTADLSEMNLSLNSVWGVRLFAGVT